MKTCLLIVALLLACGIEAHARKKSEPGCNVTASGMSRQGKDQPWSFKVTVKAVDLAAGQACDKVEVATEEGKVLHTQALAGPGDAMTAEFKLASIPEGAAVLHVRSPMKPTGAFGRVSKLKVPGARKK